MRRRVAVALRSMASRLDPPGTVRATVKIERLPSARCGVSAFSAEVDPVRATATIAERNAAFAARHPR